MKWSLKVGMDGRDCVFDGSCSHRNRTAVRQGAGVGQDGLEDRNKVMDLVFHEDQVARGTARKVR